LHPVQQHRERAGLSLAELAELTGLSVSTLQKIEHETSEYKINRGVAIILADAFYCKVEDLFDRHELSHLGRPPLTGRPIVMERIEFTMRTTSSDGRQTELQVARTRQGIPCPNCYVVMPMTNVCDDCG
jgi:DNA-binding XRE family transcriptional regulator